MFVVVVVSIDILKFIKNAYFSVIVIGFLFIFRSVYEMQYLQEGFQLDL